MQEPLASVGWPALREPVVPPICVPQVSDGKSVVLAGFLNAAPNVHGGAFRKSTNLQKQVSQLLQRSPGICPE